MRTGRAHMHRSNSMITLGIFVFFGVVLTTLVQAEQGLSEPADAAAYGLFRSSYHTETDKNRWLLPAGVGVSKQNGFRAVQLQETDGETSLSFGVGYQGDDRDAQAYTATGGQAGDANGAQLFLRVGHRW